MNYLTKQDIKNVIAKLIDFEAQLNNLYAMQGINIDQNTGRRNMLLSPVQEKELANQLRQKLLTPAPQKRKVSRPPNIKKNILKGGKKLNKKTRNKKRKISRKTRKKHR